MSRAKSPCLAPKRHLGGNLEAILGHLGALLDRLVGLCWAVLKPPKSHSKTRSIKAPFVEDVSNEIAMLGPQEVELNPPPPPGCRPPPKKKNQVYSFRQTDRTRSALSATCLARDGKRPFLERVWDRFLVRYSCSSFSSSPRPLSHPTGFTLYPCLIRLHVCPSWLSWGGSLGYILRRIGSFLNCLEAVLGQLGAL